MCSQCIKARDGGRENLFLLEGRIFRAKEWQYRSLAFEIVWLGYEAKKVRLLACS
jgi:hypothetical protein